MAYHTITFTRVGIKNAAGEPKVNVYTAKTYRDAMKKVVQCSRVGIPGESILHEENWIAMFEIKL